MSNLIGSLTSIKSCKNFNDLTYEKLESKLNIKEKEKKATNNKWSKKEVELLKKCIKIFGYDFDLIKKYFKNKNRKQLLNKFKKLKLVSLEYNKLNEEEIKKHLNDFI